jgi:hypothetical protein
MKLGFPRSTSHLWWAQVGIVVLMFALAVPEMGFAPPQGIQEAGGAWELDVFADPTYPVRALLLELNIAGAGMVGVLTFALFRKHHEIGMEGIALTIGLSIVAFIKAWLWSPFWLNGVPYALALMPRPDMDPKALIPAIWFPNATLWQLVIFTMIALLYIAIPCVIALTIRGVWQRRRWYMALLAPLPLLIAIALVWGTPGLGAWLGD